MDSSRILTEPCPHCGGKVEWWSFGADCRGNPASYGIDCQVCKASFTPQEWAAWAESQDKSQGNK